VSQDPNLPGGVSDRMLDDAYEDGLRRWAEEIHLRWLDLCICGHGNSQHDHDTADGDYGEPYVVTLACEAKGCPCKKFRRAD